MFASWKGVNIAVVEDGQWGIRTEGYESYHQSPRSATHALASILYTILHTGRPASSASNDSYLPADIELEAALEEGHDDLFVLEPCEIIARSGIKCLVTVSGIRVEVEERDLQVRDGRSYVRIPAIRQNLSPGFMLLNSTCNTARLQRNGLVRLYVKLEDASEATTVWKPLARVMAEHDAPWQMKCISRSNGFSRDDALVVYGDHALLNQLLVELVDVVTQKLPKIKSPSINPWVHPLSDRVGLAFEPDDSRLEYANLSFGLHRSRVTAEALISAIRHGIDPLENIKQHSIHANIDSGAPWRNLTSPELEGLKRS